MTTPSLKTLVLNANYKYLNITDWFQGFVLLLEEKATMVESYHNPIRSQHMEWQMPAIIVMKNYVVGKNAEKRIAPSNKNILMRDGFKCAYCGCKLSYSTVTKDHVIPQSKGGKNTFTNLVSSCKSCNNQKADRSCEEAGMFPSILPRNLTNEERIKCLVKTLQSKERMVWTTWLKDNNISLW